MSGILVRASSTFANPPGDIDATFGAGGLVVTDFNGDDYATAVLVQPDGKIVVAGTREIANNPDFALARYNSDGTLDGTFGTGGRVTTDFSAGAEIAKAAVLQADGKIVVCGDRATIGPSDFVLARYNPDGTLDGTFGSSGKVTTDVSTFDNAETLLVQSDGKLVLAGGGGAGTGDFAVLRYLPNGALDPTFGIGGVVLTDFPAGRSDHAYALVQQPDGKLVAGGRSLQAVGSDDDFGFARYDVDGSLDPSFGSGGTLTIDVDIVDSVLSLALQADGKIVAAGNTPNPVVARLNPDGTPDSSFGTSGIAVFPSASATGAVHAVVIGPGGEVLLAISDGPAFPQTSRDTIVLRLNADGTPDDRFGVAGYVTTQVAGVYFDAFVAAVLQPDAKLIIAGHTGSPRDFALARYEARSGLACAAMPAAGCKVPSRPGASTVRVRHQAPDGDNVSWSWKRGGATTFAELGNPLTGDDDYALCVYDESGMSPVLLLGAMAPAGGVCAGRPCWQVRGGRGYAYKDKELTPQGILKLAVKSAKAGHATVRVQGHGANLALPSLPLGLPMRFQLQTGDGTCWEAVFGAAGAAKNSAADFIGRSN